MACSSAKRLACLRLTANRIRSEVTCVISCERKSGPDEGTVLDWKSSR